MRVQKFIPRWRVTGAVLVLALFTAAPLLGQQTGTLTGTAISQGTGQPLSDVQIAVTGTGLGQLTNQDGRFLIVNVPVGEHEIVAQLIGYGATTRRSPSHPASRWWSTFTPATSGQSSSTGWW